MTKEEHLSAIKQADHEYYDLDNPTLSDAEYDKLRRSYIDQYGAEDLNYVPGNVADGFEKFKHPTPVTSLGKWTKGVDSEDDLKKQIEKLWPVEVQPKYDGLTVVAYPQSDRSYKFVTRGLGGEIGEVLPNFIPVYEFAHAKDGAPLYPIRGEVFITPENFKRLNAALEADGEEPMKNMRNAAAGLLRRKERSPHLDLLSYIVYDVPGRDMTPEQVHNYISESTTIFEVTSSFSYDSVDETIKGIEELYADINTLQPYPIDGMVIKSCQENSLAKFGYTGHHPKNAVAWKPGRTVFTTVIRDVIWQMGRSKATPVAIVDPVEIDGATVTKASLHNAEQIKKLGLKIGAKVTIYKANEIIPQIGEVLEQGDKDIILDVCPACGGPLKEVNGQQFCTNPDCTERIAQDIAFLGQKDVLDIPGLSIQTARKIVEKYPKLIENYKQYAIFVMEASEFTVLPGFAQKSGGKLYNTIQGTIAATEFSHFIKALCIPGIGQHVGQKLQEYFGSVDDIFNTIFVTKDRDELLCVDGLGPMTVNALLSEQFSDNWDRLIDIGFCPIIEKKKEAPAGEFVDKVFVLTGKMEHPRSYYEELIAKAGAKTGSGVSKTTDYLVIADVNSTSTKAKKARELGTKLISPEELEEMLQ